MRANLGRCFIGITLVCLAWGPTMMTQPAQADRPPINTRLISDDGAKSSPDDVAELSETEKVVLQMVRSHLSELVHVLEQLRSTAPGEYELAIKELSKAARRLDLARERDPALFRIEVELLQAQHQVTLLIAKLKVRDSQSDRIRLREAAKRLQQAQITRAEYDVEVFRQRVARSQQQLDAAIKRLETRRDEAEEHLEKSFQVMLRKSGREIKRPSPNSPSPPPTQRRSSE